MAKFKVTKDDGTIEEIEAFTSEEIAEQIKAKTEEATQGLLAKNTELLDEVKKFKGKSKELTDLVDRIEKEKREAELNKQKQQGEYQKLYEDSQTVIAEKEKQIEQLRTAYRDEKLSVEAKLISSSLVKDERKRKVLERDVPRYLAINEDGQIEYVIDGNKAKIDDVKKLLVKEYDFLIDANGASGGGAGGGGGNPPREGDKRDLNAVFDELYKEK